MEPVHSLSKTCNGIFQLVIPKEEEGEKGGREGEREGGRERGKERERRREGGKREVR